MSAHLTRRGVLAGTGALVVSFSSLGQLLAQEGTGAQSGSPANAGPLPGSLEKFPFLDSWIRIEADGSVTVFTGKAELGQGIKTALLQVAAEELDVPFSALKLVTADTARTANEGFTAGSHSMQDSGVAIMHAAAQARALLIAEAARKFGVSPDQIKTESGVAHAPDGRTLRYGELVSDQFLHVEAQPQSPLKDAKDFTIVGRPQQRVDIPAKVTGGEAYVQDLRLPGMVHARVVRPPSYGAKLDSVDTSEIEKMPGVVKVVRDGDFLAVVAKREYQAIKAMRKLAAAAHWQEQARLPKQADLAQMILGLPARDVPNLDRRQPNVAAAKKLEATYTRPYQMHGSIGPSCAVARRDGDQITVWTHTQGVFPDRDAIAGMLRVPKENVRCIHVEGSGCYGHNGADDAAGDAAVIAQALPGMPVRVQWMREQEHAWEPYGPAMVTKVSAALDQAGTIVDWNYEVWSNTHSMRPGGPGALLAAQSLAQPFAPPEPKPLPLPEGGGDRNAIPLYRLPSARVLYHFVPDMPLRISALRALGAYANVFSIESFMDELAAAAGADPVEFRLKHLDDARARDVITTAAERFGWSSYRPGAGRGFAFARYKNLAAYCAVAAEVAVERETGRVRLVRAVAAIDSGQAVNPDGIANQTEGAILQSASWTLYENVTFDDTRITSIDWSTYPILRFDAVPDSIDVHVIDRPGQPLLGSGEAGQGPAAAAVANAVADATGHRFRDLPLTRRRIKQALGV
ncbi:MAG: xanthine dehydrogenase family protein molybdopterin-binding subunit [Hyphomicrobiales bacterium]|nr:xanthine dehydrogenase family protein molybdopterin-binding subunit [Hyphomicrobiales bacterium]MBV9427170.1 xanthine dehydrogenase family protein molybdopterin-binding subunit [Bradyrhizobiaceae bacterium]